MELHDAESAIEGILFAAGEPVSLERLAAVTAVDKETVTGIAARIGERLESERRGIRLVRMENRVQLVSAPEYADYIRAALEEREMPKLSEPAMETLAIIAYFQPATRAYVEKVRGVDSSYTVGLLTERGFVEPCGKLDAPGRPTLFRTTDKFLRTFGMESLSELPLLPETEDEDEGQMKLLASIEALKGAAEEGQAPESAETTETKPEE